MVDAPVVQVVLATPVVVNDRCTGSDLQNPVEVPQKQYSDKVVDVPVVQVVVVPQVQFFVAVDVPVTMQRQLSREQCSASDSVHRAVRGRSSCVTVVDILSWRRGSFP